MPIGYMLFQIQNQLTWFADQNQPLISFGKNSGLSHPSKSHLRKHQFKCEQSKKGSNFEILKMRMIELVTPVKVAPEKTST